MRTVELMFALVGLVVLSCGGNGRGPVLATDGDHGGQETTIGDGRSEVCSPACEGRQCGPDGCGGNCGECEPLLQQCSEAGKCEPFPCQSSKDCPGTLVCADELDICVACVGDEDCPEGEACGPDHACHAVHPCTSDKECKDFELVCDKAAGVCVQCLKSEHCEAGKYCREGFCLPVLCEPGASKCDGSDVLVCPDGSGWQTAATCDVLQYCEDGQCKDLVCPPAETWCEGSVAFECAADGKSIVSEEDCAVTKLFCFAGQCIETVCTPEAIYCLDADTVATCAEDGMGFAESDCPAQHYCQGEECLPWLCEPNIAACNGTVAAVCNATGSGYASQTDCTALKNVCVDGKCLDLECSPSQAYCIDQDTSALCAADGLSHVESDCQEKQSCQDGACLPWTCMPGEPLCDGAVATFCDELGLGAVVGGTDCAAQKMACVGGQCVACSPDCAGKWCGPDGCGGVCGACDPGQACINGKCPPPGMECDDGNDIDWDGCTDGKITEFRVNEWLNGDLRVTDLLDLDAKRVLVGWFGISPLSPAKSVGDLVVSFDGPATVGQPNLMATASADGNPGALRSCARKDGSVVSVWHAVKDTDGETSYLGVHGRFLDADGKPVGDAFDLSQPASGEQRDPDAGCIESGPFLATWLERPGTVPYSWTVRARWFDEQGAPVDVAAELSSTYADRARSACQPSGACVLVWSHSKAAPGSNSVFALLAPGPGQPYGAPVTVHQNVAGTDLRPDIAALATGDFMVLWENEDKNGKHTIVGHRLSSSGLLKGDIKLIAAAPDWESSSRPTVAAVLGGGWVCAWQGYSPEDNSQGGISTRAYGSDDSALFGVVNVNSLHDGLQSEASVTRLGDAFVVAWWGNFPGSPPGSAAEIFAQRIDLQGNRLYR
ncbi:MAG: hypothetical protein FJ109_07770 [Deltaproteobacteria bacterium]|nr:hypothetical protein [Deltaproteobacteria bacterium]